MAINSKTVQRITIIIIAVVLTVGTLGTYFIFMLQQDTTNPAQQTPQYPNYPVDTTAFKTEAKVESLQKTDVKVGDGQEAKEGDNVKVHYKGTFAKTGQKFDSSYDSGEPVEFELKSGMVIDGWVQGVPGMKVGGKRQLIIPSALAYGAQGYPGSIPPNTDLVFEIELLGIAPKQ